MKKIIILMGFAIMNAWTQVVSPQSQTSVLPNKKVDELETKRTDPTKVDKDCHVADCNTAEGYVVRIVSHGKDLPRSIEDKEDAHAGNRRVDIETDVPIESNTVELEETNRGTIAGELMVSLPSGGVLWATEDPAVNQPRLYLLGPQRVKFIETETEKPVKFNYYCNYPAFIERMELLIYRQNDTDLVDPIVTLPVEVNGVGGVEWNGHLPTDIPIKSGDKLLYVLRAFDKENRRDETHAASIQLLSPEEYDSNFGGSGNNDLFGNTNSRNNTGSINSLSQPAGDAKEASETSTISQSELSLNDGADQLEQALGRNSLRLQNIPVYGSRVRLYGQDLPEGYKLKINGQQYPIDMRRKFAAEFLLPVGEHRFHIILTKGEERIERELSVNVTGKYMFLVALADITASKAKTSGSIEPLASDDRYDDDFLVEGRLAFYLKGKIKGKYLITVQADTQERELNHMFDNFLDEDPKDIFRRLDPDQYYPVYGDDSKTIRDVDTQGRLYVRVGWDKSQALWGNFQTGFSGNEFAQYNRSLYGAALNWRSLKTTEYGEAETVMKAFASQSQTALGHSEFVGTGGSLYYLKHTDILPGSNRVSVEIRHRDTGQVIDQAILEQGADYDIDELQGRIILNRPLVQVVRDHSNGIIRDNPLDGNDVFILVDYEYVPTGFDADNTVAGITFKRWLNEHLAIGGTYVDENRAGDDYELAGVDVTIRAGKGTYIKVEAARSESTQAPIFYSDNGGLSFYQASRDTVSAVKDQLVTQAGGDRSGDAIGVEARINFKELEWTDKNWKAGLWWRETEGGFSVARRDIGADTTEQGVEVSGEIGDSLRLTARSSSYEQEDRQKKEQTSVLTEYRLNEKASLIGEVRHVSEQTTTVATSTTPITVAEQSGTLAALKYQHRFGKNLELYSTGQFTLDNDGGDYDNNDMLTVGSRYRFGKQSRIGAEYSKGHRGDGGNVNLEYQLNANHTIYQRYSFSTDSTDDPFNLYKNGLTLGHRSRLSKKVNIFTEGQQLKGAQYNGINETFGLDFNPGKGWILGMKLQHGNLESALGEVDRDAASFSASYRNAETQWSTKLEYRRDDGAEQRLQWLSTNRFVQKLDDDWRLVGKFNYADTEDDLKPSADARFVESSVGFAYRPVENDRWSAFGRYTYLYDLRALEQINSGTNQRSNVFSVEGVYRVNDKWEMGAKLAHRESALRSARNEGRWFDSSVNFFALQGRYHLLHEWDGLLEYRHLGVKEAEDNRQGWLIGVDRHIGQFMKFGVGYNFTDFSDDLTDLDYEYQGIFINLVGKY